MKIQPGYLLPRTETSAKGQNETYLFIHVHVYIYMQIIHGVCTIQCTVLVIAYLLVLYMHIYILIHIYHVVSRQVATVLCSALEKWIVVCTHSRPRNTVPTTL